MLRLFLGAATLAVACGPDPLCACASTTTLLFGTVKTSAGAAIQAATLTGYGTPLPGSCAPSTRILNQTASNSNGAYRLQLTELAPSDSECVFLAVHAPGGTGLRDTTLGPLRLRMRAELADSLAVNVVLSP